MEKNTKLVRDDVSKALLSDDLNGLKAYKLKKNRDKVIDERLNKMESNIEDIKNLLIKLAGTK